MRDLAAEQTRSVVKPLVLSFFAFMVSFVGSAAYSQVRTRSIAERAHSIAGNAMPSIERLAAARTELRHIQEAASAYVTAPPLERAALLAEMVAAHRAVVGEVDAYLRLPVYPGENELWREIRGRLVDVDQTVADMRSIAQRSDPSRLAAGIARLRGACEAAVAAVMDDVQFNAANGRSMATEITQIRRESLIVALVLNVASVAMTALMSVLALRAVRSHTAFLRKHSDLLAGRAEELERFAGRVAHDIRNPLNAVMLSLQQLNRHAEEPKAVAVVNRGVRSLHRATQILDALLEFARAGGTPVADASADLRQAIDDVLETLLPVAREANVQLRCEPEGSGSIACEPSILTVLLSNLIHNAIKYMGDGPVREVTVRVQDRNDQVRIEVTDTGVGVPVDLRQAIFEPFTRGLQHGQPGVGLGLATVKRICEKRGGRVGVDAPPAGGSCFWVQLPKARSDTARSAHGGTSTAGIDHAPGRTVATGSRPARPASWLPCAASRLA